jgi:hypothetical protein
MVTAAAKMRHGERVMLSLAGTIPETLVFDTDAATVKGNFDATDDLIESLGKDFQRPEDGGTCVWTDVQPREVLNFVIRYRPQEKARKVQTEPLRRYIETRVNAGELISWTVALISIAGAENRHEVGGVEVGLVRRHPDDPEALKDGRYVLRRMISPTDESIDFPTSTIAEALEETRRRWRANPGRTRRKEEPDVPSGLVLRDLRPAQRGLILVYPLDPGPAGLSGPPVIGYAISFPGSSTAGAIEYVVNNVYYQQELALA